MKLAYFNIIDGLILQWLDADAHNFNLPDSSMLHECTMDEWARQNLNNPQMVKNGAIVDYVQPAVSLEDLHTAKVAAIKATAASLLQPTDWMVVRAAEGVKTVPADVAAYRQSVRDASNANESVILDCVDVPALELAVKSMAWPDVEQ